MPGVRRSRVAGVNPASPLIIRRSSKVGYLSTPSFCELLTRRPPRSPCVPSEPASVCLLPERVRSDCLTSRASGRACGLRQRTEDAPDALLIRAHLSRSVLASTPKTSEPCTICAGFVNTRFRRRDRGLLVHAGDGVVEHLRVVLRGHLHRFVGGRVRRGDFSEHAIRAAGGKLHDHAVVRHADVVRK